MTLNTILGEKAIEYIKNHIADWNGNIEKELQGLKESLGSELAKTTSLLALSPLDGRYYGIADELREYFSEFALIKYRVYVEIRWLKFLLSRVKDSSLKDRVKLFRQHETEITNISDEFTIADAMRVKEIEKVTNHDVKAVEYFIGEKLKEKGLEDLVSLVHIGCTSEDINNLAYALMIRDAREEVYIVALKELINKIDEFVTKYNSIAMLARTHGQEATPTTLGKELKVYIKRMIEATHHLDEYDTGKFNGATGNYSAISIAFPNENWRELNQLFVQRLGLNYNPITTQIESHDDMYLFLNDIKHINCIIRNLDVDMWMYISIQYFKQKVVKGEVGSSAMPHKVNPIKFENSEGNSYVSNGLIDAVSDKLMRTRWQRDLSDSTVQRYIGEAMGTSLKLIKETTGGLMRCTADLEKIAGDLDCSWQILAEPIQTMLRKYGIPDAYDQLKTFARGNHITKEDIHAFVNSLDVLSEEDRETLLNLTPGTYTGLAEEIANIDLDK